MSYSVAFKPWESKEYKAQAIRLGLNNTTDPLWTFIGSEVLYRLLNKFSDEVQNISKEKFEQIVDTLYDEHCLIVDYGYLDSEACRLFEEDEMPYEEDDNEAD